MYRALTTDIENLPELLRVRAEEIGSERFVRDAHQEWTYGEFAERVREVAAGLRELGVEQGDVVGVVLPNSPHYLEVWWAILWLGGIFNPVNPVLTAREIVGILSDSEAKCVVCTPEVAAGLEENREELPALREIVAAEGSDLAAPCAATAASPSTPRSTAPTSPPSSTPRAPPAGPRGRCSATPTSSPTPGSWRAAAAPGGDTLGMVLPLFHVNAQLVTTILPLMLTAAPGGDVGERLGLSRSGPTSPASSSCRPSPRGADDAPLALLHAPGADEAEGEHAALRDLRRARRSRRPFSARFERSSG